MRLPLFYLQGAKQVAKRGVDVGVDDDAAVGYLRVRHGLAHSYPAMERFFLSQGLGACLPDLRRFYDESPYLCLDTAKQSPTDSKKVRVA